MYCKLLKNLFLYSNNQQSIRLCKKNFRIQFLSQKIIKKYLSKNQYTFKVKVVALNKNVGPTAFSMRKTLKQFKKGYKAEKGQTNSIDIIDKYYDSVKFQQIKAQLSSMSIKYFEYYNLENYIKSKKFISPFIICNFQERFLLCRYLNKIQSSAKIIIFCNKTKITSQLKNDKSFSYVTTILKKKVYRPVIFAQNQIKINEKVEKVEKLKNENKLMPALKQYELDDPIENKEIHKQFNMKLAETSFQFLNVAKNVNINQIRDLQKDAAMLWKLDYKPFQNFKKFKYDLSNSLAKLKRIYKLNYPQYQFSSLLLEIKEMDVGVLLLKVKEFILAQNQLGLNINSTIAKIQSQIKMIFFAQDNSSLLLISILFLCTKLLVLENLNQKLDTTSINLKMLNRFNTANKKFLCFLLRQLLKQECFGKLSNYY